MSLAGRDSQDYPVRSKVLSFKLDGDLLEISATFHMTERFSIPGDALLGLEDKVRFKLNLCPSMRCIPQNDTLLPTLSYPKPLLAKALEAVTAQTDLAYLVERSSPEDCEQSLPQTNEHTVTA